MPRIRLAPDAVEDLEAIAEYTIERFGLNQAALYREGILGAIDLLAENPLLGTAQESIMINARRFVHQSHVIYYEVALKEIVVLRILGPGQDPMIEFR